ncbi:MAG TPA: hypothetical protein VH088_14930 [Terriglobales bacterium]|jgi:hypothetical protein|nr:hypothetical protein [Terriglobales bacterium]
MQFAKDSFFMALRERLTALNPARTITVNGITRPAIVVAENEIVVPVEPLPDAFYIEWGVAGLVERQTGARRLMEMDCGISYHTLGVADSGVDRGRELSALDTELLNICQPGNTAKQDFTQSPNVDLGTRIVWSEPGFGEVSGVIAQESSTRRIRLERKTKLKVFFFPEVNFQ